MDTIYDFVVRDIDGKEVSLEAYAGKVLLIVNTASKCGFTGQLTNMAELYKEFEGEDFEILAFPSSDFNGQEPLEGEALKQFCMLDYKAEYPIFDKVHVKGKEATPLFQHLSDRTTAPKWNFYKYLVNKQGEVVDHYVVTTSPTAGRVKRKIRKLLNEN